MFPAASRTHVERWFGPVLAGCVLAAGLGARAAEETGSADPPAVSPEDQARIDATSAVDSLRDLGKLFVFKRKYAAAALCVQKACEAEPALLTDSQRQSPKSWNEFWFKHRAALQAGQLEKDDIDGRVELAKWLQEANVQAASREMLKAALRIDPKHAEANKLAEAWNLYGGGPVELDLRYALTKRLVLDSFQDENEDVRVSRGRVLLLVPFAYNPGEDKLNILKGNLRVRSDEGRACPVKGIVLLQGTPAAWLGDTRSSSQSGEGNILFERLEVEHAAEKDAYEVTCHNMVRPVSPGSGGTRSPGRGAGRGPGFDRPEPKAQQGDGLAAFLIEIPEATKYIECTYRGGSPLRLEMTLLDILSMPAAGFAGPDGAASLETLFKQTAARQRVLASAAVWKLRQLRSPSPRGRGAPAEEAFVPDEATLRIESALLGAIGHPDRFVQHEAFAVMFLDAHPLSPMCLEMIEGAADAGVLLFLLEHVEESLSASTGEADPRTPRLSYASVDDSDVLARAVEALPASPDLPNVFAGLSACLRSRHAAVRARALEVLLGDGTRKSARAVADASPEAKRALIQTFAGIEDDELKAALLRVLLLRSDPDTMSKLLTACQGLAVTIRSEDDPLLMALQGQHPGPVMGQLFGLLAKADVRAVIGSEKFSKLLDQLAMEQQDKPEVQSALLELALQLFGQAPYEEPIGGDAARGGGRRPQNTSGLEPLLARRATAADARPEEAQAAARALIGTGRIDMLTDEFKRMSDPRRGQELVRALGREKELWNRGALPHFLASCLTHDDATISALAIRALAAILDGTEPKERWRAGLAIKQGLDLKRLVALTLDPNDAVAQPAMAVLAEVLKLDSAAVHELQGTSGEDARHGRVTTLIQERVAKPAGMFASMVYLDVKSSSNQSSPRGSQEIARTRVPLAASDVTIQPVGDADHRIIANGREINIRPDSPQAGRGGRGGAPGSLQISVASLLRAALTSSDAQREGLAGVVDLSPLTADLVCDLKADPFGTWTAEVPNLNRRGTSDRPLDISGARIVLEPVSP